MLIALLALAGCAVVPGWSRAPKVYEPDPDLLIIQVCPDAREHMDRIEDAVAFWEGLCHVVPVLSTTDDCTRPPVPSEIQLDYLEFGPGGFTGELVTIDGSLPGRCRELKAIGHVLGYGLGKGDHVMADPCGDSTKGVDLCE